MATALVGVLAARRVLLVAFGICAVTAVLAGLARLGFPLPSSDPMGHGPLLVLGVFAGIIAVERAVALGSPWAYLAPGLTLLGALAQLAGLHTVAPMLALAGTVVLVGVNVAVVKRQNESFTVLMLLASVLLLIGTAAWLRGAPVFTVVPTWLGFFVVTIVAERLELSRLVRTPRWATRVLIGLCLMASLGAVLAIWWVEPPLRLFGVSLLGLSTWQLGFDLARRTIRTSGLPQFAALGVLLGAGWLGVSGAGLVAVGLPAAGPVYDALLHAIFVGFVLSMVFAHAPIILPAVARVDIPFHRVLYVPLSVLHLSLALRVLGDVFALPELRRLGGLGNALAIVTFAVAVMFVRSRRTDCDGPA